jgi:chromosome segregation ATPase
MKRKVLKLGVLLLVISLVVVGCGIPQETYDVVVAERDAAQSEVQVLQGELDKAENDLATVTGELATAESQIETVESNMTEAENQIETLESDIADAESQIESLRSSVSAARGQLSSFRSDLNTSWTSLETLLALNYIALGIYAELAADDLDDIYTGCSLMTEGLAYLDDAGLSALWEAAFVVDGGEWNLYYVPYEDFVQALAERIESESDALSNKL